MQIPDIWSLLTGSASIISLFLSAGEKFAVWRKYTIPAAAALGGFAVGRLSPSLSSGVSQLFGDPAATGFILLFFLIVSAITFVAFLLMKNGQVGLAYFVFLLGLVSIPTAILPMYSKTIDTIPAGDHIKLAQVKAQAKEYEQATKYLESARDKTRSSELKKEIEEQIKILQKQTAKITINPAPE